MNEDQRLAYVVALAASLKPASRKKLLDQLALLAAQDKTGKADRDISMWATSVYEAFTRAFGASAGAGQGPLVFQRVLGASTAWAPVEAFMQASGLAQQAVVKRQAVYRLLAHLVVQRAKSVAAHTRAPVSLKFVANVAREVNAIFEAEFPGYLAAGLAPLVAAQLGKDAPHGREALL